MATLEVIDEAALREGLVERLDRIHDVQILRSFAAWLDDHSPAVGVSLSPEEKTLLEQGRKEYVEGRWITNEQLKEKVARWRNEKK